MKKFRLHFPSRHRRGDFESSFQSMVNRMVRRRVLRMAVVLIFFGAVFLVSLIPEWLYTPPPKDALQWRKEIEAVIAPNVTEVLTGNPAAVFLGTWNATTGESGRIGLIIPDGFDVEKPYDDIRLFDPDDYANFCPGDCRIDTYKPDSQFQVVIHTCTDDAMKTPTQRAFFHIDHRRINGVNLWLKGSRLSGEELIYAFKFEKATPKQYEQIVRGFRG